MSSQPVSATHFSALKNKIEQRQAKVAVIGLGYVGLPLALLYSESVFCVPTPLNEYHEPDLSYITGTAESIAPHLQAGQLVILESTTYPGTTEEVLIPILEKGNQRGLKASRGGEPDGKSFFVAFSPEREDPGNQTVARRDIPKVIGGLDQPASELACVLYGAIFNRTVP